VATYTINPTSSGPGQGQQQRGQADGGSTLTSIIYNRGMGASGNSIVGLTAADYSYGSSPTIYTTMYSNYQMTAGFNTSTVPANQTVTAATVGFASSGALQNAGFVVDVFRGGFGQTLTGPPYIIPAGGNLSHSIHPYTPKTLFTGQYTASTGLPTYTLPVSHTSTLDTYYTLSMADPGVRNAATSAGTTTTNIYFTALTLTTSTASTNTFKRDVFEDFSLSISDSAKYKIATASDTILSRYSDVASAGVGPSTVTVKSNFSVSGTFAATVNSTAGTANPNNITIPISSFGTGSSAPANGDTIVIVLSASADLNHGVCFDTVPTPGTNVISSSLATNFTPSTGWTGYAVTPGKTFTSYGMLGAILSRTFASGDTSYTLPISIYIPANGNTTIAYSYQAFVVSGVDTSGTSNARSILATSYYGAQLGTLTGGSPGQVSNKSGLQDQYASTPSTGGAVFALALNSDSNTSAPQTAPSTTSTPGVSSVSSRQLQTYSWSYSGYWLDSTSQVYWPRSGAHVTPSSSGYSQHRFQSQEAGRAGFNPVQIITFVLPAVKVPPTIATLTSTSTLNATGAVVKAATASLSSSSTLSSTGLTTSYAPATLSSSSTLTANANNLGPPFVAQSGDPNTLSAQSFANYGYYTTYGNSFRSFAAKTADPRHPGFSGVSFTASDYTTPPQQGDTIISIVYVSFATWDPTTATYLPGPTDPRTIGKTTWVTGDLSLHGEGSNPNYPYPWGDVQAQSQEAYHLASDGTLLGAWRVKARVATGDSNDDRSYFPDFVGFYTEDPTRIKKSLQPPYTYRVGASGSASGPTPSMVTVIHLVLQNTNIGSLVQYLPTNVTEGSTATSDRYTTLIKSMNFNYGNNTVVGTETTDNFDGYGGGAFTRTVAGSYPVTQDESDKLAHGNNHPYYWEQYTGDTFNFGNVPQPGSDLYMIFIGAGDYQSNSQGTGGLYGDYLSDNTLVLYDSGLGLVLMQEQVALNPDAYPPNGDWANLWRAWGWDVPMNGGFTISFNVFPQKTPLPRLISSTSAIQSNY
jgi:hypothetical protein